LYTSPDIIERTNKEDEMCRVFIPHGSTTPSHAWTTGVQFPAGAMMRFFFLATASIPTVGHTQPPI